MALDNSLILANIFTFLEDSAKDKKAFRLVKKSWSMETLTKWRKSATIIIQPKAKTGRKSRYHFINEYKNISIDNDPNKLLRLPFHRYKIITESNSSTFIPAYFGSRGQNFIYEGPSYSLLPEFANFWNLCGPIITHLNLQNIHIQNKNSLVKLLNILLFQACPSLKQLSLEPSTLYKDPAFYYCESQDTCPISPRSSSLESFALKTSQYHPAFEQWNNPDNIKAIFSLMSHLNKLQLEGTAVQLMVMMVLYHPVTLTGEFIKLQHLEMHQNYTDEDLGPQLLFFAALNQYVKQVNPPLTSLKVDLIVANRRSHDPHHHFFQFLATNLNQLFLNVTFFNQDNPMKPFLELDQCSFPNLTEFHLNFLNHSINPSFHFRLLKHMPKLTVFRCSSDSFNYSHPKSKKNKPNSLYKHKKQFDYWNDREILPNEDIIIVLDNLTDFSFRLNYKFGRHAIQQLRNWAKNIRNLEIVVNNQEDFLEFLRNEFQWWEHSLEKVMLYCKTNLENDEAIRNAMGSDKRNVSIQFFRLRS